MDYNTTTQMAVGTGIGFGTILIMIVVYVFFAYCWALIAKKTGKEFGTSFIMALIPIANIILILQIAGKPWWWLFLFLIPIVNLILWIIVLMKVCEARGKPGWWGLLIAFIPVVNIILFLILAFGKETNAPAVA